MNLTEPRQRALASIKLRGYAAGNHGGQLHIALEREGLIEHARPVVASRLYRLSAAGDEALRIAIRDADNKACTALGNANAAKEKGKPSPRYEASAQRWLDLANDLRGDGYGGAARPTPMVSRDGKPYCEICGSGTDEPMREQGLPFAHTQDCGWLVTNVTPTKDGWRPSPGAVRRPT